MAFGDPAVIEPGVPDLGNLKADRQDTDSGTASKNAAYLARHDAVRLHGDGMTSDDLHSFAEAFADYSRSRILNVGAEQYADEDGQKFESMTYNQIILELVDEIADAQNYLTMLGIKVLTLHGALDHAKGV